MTLSFTSARVRAPYPVHHRDGNLVQSSTIHRQRYRLVRAGVRCRAAMLGGRRVTVAMMDWEVLADLVIPGDFAPALTTCAFGTSGSDSCVAVLFLDRKPFRKLRARGSV